MHSPKRCLLALGLTATAVLVAGTSYGADRSTLMKCFDALRANSLKAIKQGKAETIEMKVTPASGKFRLVGDCEIEPAPPIIPGGLPTCLAVKIWGQPIDSFGQGGAYVNLTKHKWQRRERFYLWLETAVPIQLAFFQNYPEGRPASRQVSPDVRFPETFATIMPGAPYRFPVKIELDDDLRDEQMSLVVVRADSQVLAINGAPISSESASAYASAIITTQTGTPGQVAVEVEAGAGSRPALAGVVGPGGTLKGPVIERTRAVLAELNTYALSQPKTKSARMKLRLLPPEEEWPEFSKDYNEVSNLLLGPGNLAQIELTLHKD